MPFAAGGAAALADALSAVPQLKKLSIASNYVTATGASKLTAAQLAREPPRLQLELFGQLDPKKIITPI